MFDKCVKKKKKKTDRSNMGESNENGSRGRKGKGRRTSREKVMMEWCNREKQVNFVVTTKKNDEDE